jgi:predicted RNase H-like nuclease (RuvC/YqgF family)
MMAAREKDGKSKDDDEEKERLREEVAFLKEKVKELEERNLKLQDALIAFNTLPAELISAVKEELVGLKEGMYSSDDSTCHSIIA